MNNFRAKKWPRKNLGPLIELLIQEFPDGLALSAVEEKTGISQKGLSSTFCKDDTHLSKVEAIARALGYKLHLRYQYQGNYPPDSTFTPSSKAGNLYGLEEYCQRLNRSVNYVATVCGVKRDTIASALSKGDIMVATLNRITAKIGLSIEWSFTRTTGNE